jgi:ketosteroid isomerase-like protein
MKSFAARFLLVLSLWLSVTVLPGFAQSEPFQMASSDQAEAINSVIDAWHEAAANGDFEGYFGKFASDDAIFMGTDRTERWTVAEFREWSKPYFDRGKAWDFEAVSRTVYTNAEGTVAWFDEQLDTPNLGPSRGSGVLVHKDGMWKIAHYNLSVPIPNPLVDSFVELIRVWEQKEKQ